MLSRFCTHISACVAQESSGKCTELNGQCWCFHVRGKAIDVCGHPSDYNGKYYSLAFGLPNSPHTIIKAVGKTPDKLLCSSDDRKNCEHNCGVNACDPSGMCWGTDLSCKNDNQRWHSSDFDGIVRCTNLEGRQNYFLKH